MSLDSGDFTHDALRALDRLIAGDSPDELTREYDQIGVRVQVIRRRLQAENTPCYELDGMVREIEVEWLKFLAISRPMSVGKDLLKRFVSRLDEFEGQREAMAAMQLQAAREAGWRNERVTAEQLVEQCGSSIWLEDGALFVTERIGDRLRFLVELYAADIKVALGRPKVAAVRIG
jgi:hypothetical protein